MCSTKDTSFALLRKSSTAAIFALLGPVAAAQEPASPINARTLGPIPSDQHSDNAREASVPLVQQDAYNFARTGERLLVLQPRIIGGVPAPIGAYPWQVSLAVANLPASIGHFCGGSVLDSKWVLTAAHCVDGNTQPSGVQVTYGTNFLGQGGTTANVEKIFIHDGWNPSSYDYDIALLRISDTILTTPIKLVAPGDVNRLMPVGVLATVSGWGLTRVGSGISDVLQHVGVQVTSNEVCNNPTSYAGKITDRMLCAGFATGGQDSCQGDSGGPLVVFDQKGGYSLAGVVSWGEGCAEPQKYGVYTSVPTVAEWITETMKNQAPQ
ncbi:serine protease [Sinorhizobium meliloti]|uniref:serine protease n=1 Tax=Rhizobium meliloti TaxID=382 RepID=UPI0009B698B5|nr:serine protease [Sinorhizobium meliloti]